MEETIAAISTALGVGAISIIRVSGPESIEIVNKIFSKDITNVKSHTIHYGHILNNKEIIDEVLISVLKAPKTFTKEDIVEINCHGGIVTTNKVLSLVLDNGARLAEPGEFTKRAFLNGRIDLTQADGIMNLIEAKTDKARQISINQLTGSVSNVIKEIRQELVEIISNIEVNIDYPEYEDIHEITNNEIYLKIKEVSKKISNTIKNAENGKLIKEGITIAIIGRPNVGKSSLLNKLLEEEKAIVTDIEGTTRDTVEGKIVLNNIVCNIIDTAGIRETENVVERIGVNKSLDTIEKANLIILLLNNNEKLTEEDKKLLHLIEEKEHLIVINKIDLENKLQLKNKNTISISTKENLGIDSLKNKIIEIFNLEKIATEDMTYLSNARSLSLLNQASHKIKESMSNIESNMPIDIVEIDIKECWNLLGEIIGETYTEKLLEEIFSRFCLGK